MKTLCSVSAGVRPDPSSGTVSLQTFQLGDDVTIKCFSTKNSFGNTMVWYKQSTGQIPRLIALSYDYWKDFQFEKEFKDGRFIISASEDSFHLNITATTKDDIGKYYCGIVFLNKIGFISGAHLMLKDNNNQKVWDSMLLCLISSNVVFVIVIIALLVDHCKRWRKRQKGSKNVASPSYEIEDSDVNYASVSFASVPPARRSNNRHLSEYTEVNYKPRDHML
ncbi:novel immune-type receptor 6b [Garra rufa]|uniref:novel immune-type receptor 6b n=1 Tax=Garra rufa TaxID=137080 RepID=UPI003CCE5F2F